MHDRFNIYVFLETPQRNKFSNEEKEMLWQIAHVMGSLGQ